MFELLGDREGVAVVREAPFLAQAFAEGIFTGVPERRMADIVKQGQRFHQVLIEPQCRGRQSARSRLLRACA